MGAELLEAPVWFFIITCVPLLLMISLFLKVVIKTWKMCNIEEMEGKEVEESSSKESFYDYEKTNAA